jgi:hypothetical protein
MEAPLIVTKVRTSVRKRVMLDRLSRFPPLGALVMAKQRRSTKTVIGGSRELLTWALQGLEQEIGATRQRLQGLESQARTLRASARGVIAAVVASAAPVAAAAVAPTVRKKRKLSADARKRIADAQKRRWAKVRAGKA